MPQVPVSDYLSNEFDCQEMLYIMSVMNANNYPVTYLTEAVKLLSGYGPNWTTIAEFGLGAPKRQVTKEYHRVFGLRLVVVAMSWVSIENKWSLTI
jgi:hypothetical protein